MKKHLLKLICVMVSFGFSATYADTQLNASNCGVEQLPLQTPSIKKLACNTKFALGPVAAQTVWGVPIVLPPGSPTLPSGSYVAINSAFNAWNTNLVNTRGRLTGWNTVTSASDCPHGRPLQIGMLNFAALSEGGTCLTVLANGLNTVPADPIYLPLAFVDYDSSKCVGCGTKSMVINLAVAWSTNGTPLAGQRDLESVVSHEFGHMLGMGHNRTLAGGACGDYGVAPDLITIIPSPTCAVRPDRSTMENINYTGPTETCGRILGVYDVMRANQIYSTAEICQ